MQVVAANKSVKLLFFLFCVDLYVGRGNYQSYFQFYYSKHVQFRLAWPTYVTAGSVLNACTISVDMLQLR